MADEVAATPGGITLVDADDLRERNVATLADLLRYVPGVWSVSDSGGDDIFFSSRGSNLDATDYDMNGIKLLQDGLPVTTADGNNHNRVLDPLSARYATVARGANALLYGASTLGGAVEFTSPTARDSSPRSVLVNAGSHGQRLARATVGTVANERFDGLVTVEGKRWDGYREHSTQDRTGLYANAGWRIADAVSTRFFATYLSNDQEMPGSLSRAEVGATPGRASANAIGGDFQINVDTLRLANKTSWQLGEARSLDIGFSYEVQELFHPIVDKVLVDFDGPTGPAPFVEVFSLLIDTDHRDVGAVVRYNQRIGKHDLFVGLNYGSNDVAGGNYRNDGGNPNGRTAFANNDAASLEIYAMDRWQAADRWLLELAAQTVAATRDVRSTDLASGETRNPHQDYSSVNPRLGFIYAIANDTDLFANLSRLYEPPTNFELDDEATGGDAVLAAMHGTVLEIGTRGRRRLRGDGSWRWDVSVYYAQIRDEILSVEDPAALGTSLSANVEATIHAGIEALISADLPIGGDRGAVIAPLLSLTINEFSFDDDAIYGDNDLPAAPAYAVRGEVLYRHPSGFHVGPTFDFIGGRFADFANTYAIDSYSLLGLRAGWSNDKWRVFAEIKNLRDEAYVASHGVRDRAAPDAALLNPGEPLSAYFGVQAQF